MLHQVSRGTAGSKMNGPKNDFNSGARRGRPIAPAKFFARMSPTKSARAPIGRGSRLSSRGGFTIVETLMSILIIAMFFSTILIGYTRANQRAQWSGYSLAAQAQSMKQLEEFRSVLWDTQNVPITDDTTNVPSVLVLPLDLPISGTNVVYATNTATVTAITNLGNTAAVKMITIVTTWPWNGHTYSNVLVAYRAPDQ